MRAHLGALHEHYGEQTGARIARKHVGWYLDMASHEPALKTEFNRLESAPAQLAWLDGLVANRAWEQAA